MTWIDSYEPEVIETALARLREDGVVWQDGTVDGDPPESLRSEVADGKADLLRRLGRVRGSELVRAILGWLKRGDTV